MLPNPSPAVHVRSATEADIPRILEIERESETVAHSSEADYLRVLADSSPRRVVLVVETAGCVQGFLTARFLHEECEIENIAVAKALRRKGLGGTLLNAFLTEARAENDQAGSIAAILLEVRESNQSARSLYKKFGFTPVGKRSNYYRSPEEDAILYRSSFQSNTES